MAPRATASSAAFDLLPRAQGAVLIWGSPGRDGGGIKAQALDALGQATRQEALVRPENSPRSFPAEAIELAAARGSGRLGVVWVERTQESITTRAAFGPEDGRFPRPVELGPASVPAEEEDTRGVVAIASRPDGTISVIHRGAERACPRGVEAERCLDVGIRRLGGSDGSSGRRGVGLVVPEPCANTIVGYGFHDDKWHYGICSRETGQDVTTVYTIGFDPEYASASEVLPGQHPIGLLVHGEVSIVAEKDGARVIGRVGQGDKAPLSPSVRCEDGHIVLARGEVNETLAEARGDLAPLLPAELAPTGSRAVFTGQSLIVAVPIPREVAMRRYECVEGQLRRTDIPS